MQNYMPYIMVGITVLLWVVMTRLGKVSSKKARQLVAEGAVLVDVRSPGEFAGGHLEGALNVPVDSIGGRAKDLAAKGRPIVVYCASGMRSGMAASALKRAGAQVFDLGGMSRW